MPETTDMLVQTYYYPAYNVAVQKAQVIDLYFIKMNGISLAYTGTLSVF